MNLTGDYVWASNRTVSENHDGLKPLRAVPEVVRKAA